MKRIIFTSLAAAVVLALAFAGGGGSLRPGHKAIGTGTSLFGDGSDGPITFSSNTTFNPPVDAVVDNGTASTTSLTVSSASGVFLAGQRILIHQTRGTSAGAWELNQVASFALGNLGTTAPLANSYASGGANAAQVLVVPEYTNVTINSGVTVNAKVWNGSTGGILAFLANGTVTLGGTITASGKGYRGPPGSTSDSGVQGEGTAGAGSHTSGPNGNGGAVTIGCQGSGGGGGHAIAGTASTNGQCQTGGGLSAGSLDLTTMVFGGAGGPGNEGPGNTGSSSGNGGDGGGIVFLGAAVLSATGSITSDGSPGTIGSPGSGGQNNSNGGGGAGGSVLIRVQSATLGTAMITAGGGLGGDSVDGHGGDGSVGRIRAEYCTSISGGTANPPASIQQISCAGSIDTDGDGCPDKFEQQTDVGSELTGGNRDYLNPYDYFNPTNDGTIRVDDILAVVGRYFSSGDPAGPLNTIPPAPPAYHPKFNRAPLGPNVWNLTQGSGQVLLADILAVIKQYFHDCGSGITKVP